MYARELAADGARFEDGALEGALSRAWQEVHEAGASDRYGGRAGEPAFWRAFLDRVRGRLDGGRVSDRAFERLAGHFRDPSSWAVYADVVPALDALGRAGLRLAVISNWDSTLPALLSDLGLAPRFGAILVSSIERTGKPEPEIFLRACARIGVAPEEALHVGDSPREDYDGARGAGLSALLLDRDGRHGAGAERIATLGDLPGRLGIGTDSAILAPA